MLVCLALGISAVSCSSTSTSTSGRTLNSVAQAGFQSPDKESVIAQYGQPSRVSSDGANEIWHYARAGGYENLQIRFSNAGEVMSFGVGDMPTAQ